MEWNELKADVERCVDAMLERYEPENKEGDYSSPWGTWMALTKSKRCCGRLLMVKN